jgi:uncharacterized membrane protein
MRSRLRTYFIAGLLVFLPLAVTFTILAWLFRILDNFLGRVVTPLYGREIPGLGLAATIVVVLVMGALVTNVLGRRLMEGFEALMLRIPLARSIYSATKAISDSIFIKRKAAFQRVVLIQWPRQGIYTVGFVTGDSGTRWIEGRGRVLNVFMVTTPNPTSGFLMFVPEDETIPLDLSVEDALKVVLSGGIVAPPEAILPIAGTSGQPGTEQAVP